MVLQCGFQAYFFFEAENRRFLHFRKGGGESEEKFWSYPTNQGVMDLSMNSRRFGRLVRFLLFSVTIEIMVSVVQPFDFFFAGRLLLSFGPTCH